MFADSQFGGMYLLGTLSATQGPKCALEVSGSVARSRAAVTLSKWASLAGEREKEIPRMRCRMSTWLFTILARRNL